MNRKTFLSNLLGLGGLSILPRQWINSSRSVLLLECFVAGFKYYEGLKLLSAMREGDTLELVREPDNIYDECAIALRYNDKKIGFIPASKNEMLSNLLDNNILELRTEILTLDPSARPWEQVYLGVFCVKHDLNQSLLIQHN